MMKKRKRGILASVGAVITATAMLFTGSMAAQADPPNVPETSNVVITKLEQPDTLGAAATGEEATTLPSDPVPNVTFEAYLVEGTEVGGTNDIGTNAGQQWASQQASPADVAALIDEANPSYTGQTDANGLINWNAVDRGLYVVKEIKTQDTPTGVTPSPDFFLTVPLTDPTNLNDWLDTIYIYPKNSVVEGTKSVVDGENGTPSFTVGENATWTINTDIPRVQEPGNNAFVAPDGFRITDTLVDAELSLVQDPTVTVGGTTLTPGTDYLYEAVAGTQPGTTTHQITFEPSGLQALADAVNADANAQVEVTLVTEVLSTGEILNSANLYPNNDSIVDNTPVPLDPAEVHYGGYQINKTSTSADADLSGAQFRVYLSEAAALAAGNDYLTPSLNPDGLWETDSNGQVVVDGLRYSNWANGQLQNETVDGAPNPLYQTYWLVETQALDGHQLLGEPIEFVVDADSATQTAQEIVNTTTEGGFELPLTGGTGTAMFTVFGVALLAGVLIVARRRRTLAADTQ